MGKATMLTDEQANAGVRLFYSTSRPCWPRDNYSPGHWHAWIAEARRLAGHDMDGDEDADGYSLDTAYDAMNSGLTPAQYVRGLRAITREQRDALTPAH
jgi:hypothetical protein